MPNSEFHDYVIQDLLHRIDGISSRAMFGGWGLYKNGVIFGLIAYDQLYFKVDDQTRPQYEAHGSKPFEYSQGNHKPTTMSYWLVPDDVLENQEELAKWVDTACEASVRSKKGMLRPK
ncbi:MAG: TfoX/Sxy family protein [Patescibacteria group bacterium]